MEKVNDMGPAPFVGHIEDLTEQNNNYRTTLWTGNNLQVTLMSIEPGKDIGLEVHNDTDQFLRVEAGTADVAMGSNEGQLTVQKANDGDAIIIPAGTWHNLTCTSIEALKLYSIYAPPHHPHGTVHVTRVEAEAAEGAEIPVNEEPVENIQSVV